MISDQDHIIFVHIPKCAGSSIKRLLRGVNNLSFKHDGWHHSVGFLIEALKKENKDPSQYFKFCISRNPYDRLVSAFSYTFDKVINKNDYHWRQYKKAYPVIEKHITPESKIESFQKFIQSDDFARMFKGDLLPVHFRPQFSFISVNNELQMDHIGRLEDMDSTLTLLEEKININRAKIHANATVHDSYKRFYNDHCIEKAIEFYKEDFINLEYSLDL